MAATAATVANQVPCEPLRVTYLKPSFSNREVAIAARQDLWHKFIIFNAAKYDKHEVLVAIINACDPEVILPVMYHPEKNGNSMFLARCSVEAIQNLVKQNLSIVSSSGKILNVDIVLGFLSADELQINPSKAITQTLYYRYESTKKILNLEDFGKSKTLGSVYCPIAAPRILLYVLRCAKMGIIGNTRDMKLPIRELILQDNKITMFIPFEKFFNYHLTKLDLRFNNMCNIEYLHYFSEFKITELLLDGNPVCTTFATPDEYISTVKNIFPHLQKLDGIVIGSTGKSAPIIQQSWLGNGSKMSVIKQFVRHFFTLYDQDDRIALNGLYDTDALYSMTVGNAASYNQKNITRVFSNNRNLLKFVDYAKCHEFISKGPDKIISVLRRQPPTTHNLRSFQVDLLHAGRKHLAISVQGVFYYKSLIFQLMFFNRTFVLVAKDDNEYSIINDQCHIDVAPPVYNTAEYKDFKFEPKEAPKFKPTVFSTSERDQLVGFLHELSTMNKEYCKKYLESAGWDIRTAVQSFMKAYTANDIPKNAFH